MVVPGAGMGERPVTGGSSTLRGAAFIAGAYEHPLREIPDRTIPQIHADVATFTPPPGTPYDALLCDMNGDPRSALRQVIRMTKFMRPGGLIIFTLKTPGTETLPAIQEIIRLTLHDAAASRFRLISLTHLTYNRQEFTCFFEC